MTVKNVSLGFALAFALSAAHARAAPSAADLAEAGAPDSVLNKDGRVIVPLDDLPCAGGPRDSRAGNPPGVDAEHGARAPIDSRTQLREVEAAEAGNPDSVDSRR
jgi:hypothetical protein